MKTKLAQIQERMRAGDWQRAVAMAAKLPQLGKQRNAILDAHMAYTNPRFAVQLRRDIDVLKNTGHTALIERFGMGA